MTGQPGTNLKYGDKIYITYGPFKVEAKVTSLLDTGAIVQIDHNAVSLSGAMPPITDHHGKQISYGQDKDFIPMGKWKDVEYVSQSSRAKYKRVKIAIEDDDDGMAEAPETS